jgi:glycosyltransferase involved in cell wall biosynthesis
LNTHGLKFSILIPVFNGACTILETMDSILSQSYENFEIIVQDNDSTDDTAKLVHSFSDPRIKYFKNPSNLGYSLNLIEGRKNCSGEILFLMSSDDLLMANALLNTYEAFQADSGVGAVTRPYYWFAEDKQTPIRVTCQMNPLQNETIKITDDFSRIRYVLDNEVLGQLSGLAFRMDCMDIDFSLEPWIAHGYPMASILKNYSIVFLKDYSVAVRVGMNETRKKSPLMTGRQ